MYQDLCRQYYWSGMKRHVGDFVRRCLTCQQVKAEHQKPTGLLQPLEVAELKWEHVTMDFGPAYHGHRRDMMRYG